MGRPELSHHRKFRRLARDLNSDAIARGCLELLWDSCYENGDDYLVVRLVGSSVPRVPHLPK